MIKLGKPKESEKNPPLSSSISSITNLTIRHPALNPTLHGVTPAPNHLRWNLSMNHPVLVICNVFGVLQKLCALFRGLMPPSSGLNNEYRGSMFFRIVGKVYWVTQRHIPDSRKGWFSGNAQESDFPRDIGYPEILYGFPQSL
jgi:hypothetical protein